MDNEKIENLKYNIASQLKSSGCLDLYLVMVYIPFNVK